jgi:hypothetical protein
MGIQWSRISAIYKLQKTCDAIGSEALYIILIEYGYPRKYVG